MKQVIIVGAGIAGLVAGVYARQSGFDVTIYESHSIPGGASTSWRRGGYFFEGGLHWLTGSSPKTAINKLWREVGALDDGVAIHNADPFMAMTYQGKDAFLYRDLERLRSHLLELSPEDEQEIHQFCKDLKRFCKMEMPLTDIKGVRVREKAKLPLSQLVGMLPALGRIGFYAGKSVGEYADRYKSPLLRRFFENLLSREYSSTGMIFTTATLVSGDGGYPEGGSLAMANRIARRFEALGGKIRYNHAVERVWVQDGVARGILVDGGLVEADAVIVTQDTLAAVDTLFEQPIREPWAEKMRRDTIPLLNTFIGLGVEADLSHLPERVTFYPEEPFICGGVAQESVGFCNYAAYKGYAPQGCTALTSPIITDNYDFWKACKENGTYEAEKQKLAQAFITVLKKEYPEISGKVKVWDVATPLTYERYLSSYKGSWMTVMPKGAPPARYPGKPESIEGLYFAGQRLQAPGGLPVAADTGRRAVQYLCKDTGTVFQGSM